MDQFNESAKNQIKSTIFADKNEFDCKIEIHEGGINKKYVNGKINKSKMVLQYINNDGSIEEDLFINLKCAAELTLPEKIKNSKFLNFDFKTKIR